MGGAAPALIGVAASVWGAKQQRKAAERQAEAAEKAAHQTVETIEHLSPAEQLAMGLQQRLGFDEFRRVMNMSRSATGMFGQGYSKGAGLLQGIGRLPAMDMGGGGQQEAEADIDPDFAEADVDPDVRKYEGSGSGYSSHSSMFGGRPKVPNYKSGVKGSNPHFGRPSIRRQAPGTPGAAGDLGQSPTTPDEIDLGFGGGLNPVQGATKEQEYAALALIREAQQTVTQMLSMLGIDNGTGSNPYGVKMTLDEYMLHKRAIDPSVHIRRGTSLADDPSDAEILALLPQMVPGADPSNGVWVARFQLLLRLARDPGFAGQFLEGVGASPQPDPQLKDAIEYWMSQGLIGKDFSVNQSQVMQKMEAFEAALIEYRTLAPMSDEQRTQWAAEYEALAAKQVDPKLIKEKDLGNGITKTTILNADGSEAASFLKGTVTLPNGERKDNVVVKGRSLQDWDMFQDKIEKTGDVFATPGENGEPVEEGEQQPGSGAGGEEGESGGLPGYEPEDPASGATGGNKRSGKSGGGHGGPPLAPPPQYAPPPPIPYQQPPPMPVPPWAGGNGGPWWGANQAWHDAGPFAYAQAGYPVNNDVAAVQGPGANTALPPGYGGPSLNSTPYYAGPEETEDEAS